MRSASGFVVDVRVPSGHDTYLPSITVEIDDNGRITRMWREDYPPARRQPITYREGDPAFVPLCAAIPWTDLRLVSFTEDTAAGGERFSRGRVEAVAAQLKLQAAQADLAAASGPARSNGQSQPPTPAAVPAPGEEWRLPLIGAGIVFVIVGLGAIIWNRRR